MSQIGAGLHPVIPARYSECSSQVEDEELKWFAVYTTPRHEKRVAEHFGLREMESFLPLYVVPRRWKDGSKVLIQLPLFPNYLFVHIPQRERVKVLAVPGVLSLVSRGRDPVALSDFDIESLRSGVHLRKAEPHAYLKEGMRVRIRCGALSGWEGVLLRKKNDFRVVLTLDQIMKSIAVEVEADEIEAVSLRYSCAPNC